MASPRAIDGAPMSAIRHAGRPFFFMYQIDTTVVQMRPP